MDFNQKIAKHMFDFVGGTPKVFAYGNEDNSKTIDIATMYESQYSDIIVVSTIGLANYDIDLRTEDNQPLRVELLAVAEKNCDVLENIVSTAAFEIMDDRQVGYGFVIQNVFGEYLKDSELEHGLLMSPQFWDDYCVLDSEEATVAWLFMIPITEKERKYIVENGVQAFDKLMEDNDIDVLDFHRKSIV